ncbi:uncharacterized protein LOC130891493 [Diorhabda carinulata]|uniref:uncharacterized protein LOC130891493 n=1 Tax=Diorhabda carinulata TaxID=1163345 RepID=UPI0025A2574E|nr:uncharacterized protein LOC130891493 [Diorhabda carinulata]
MLLVFSLTVVQLSYLIKFAGGAITLNESDIVDSFRQCLISQTPGNLGHCLGVEAVTKLQSLDNSPEFDLVDGLTLSRDARQEFRDGYNFQEEDPTNFRSIMDTVSYVFSKRNMRWNMGFIYPGLMMHVSPSGHPGGTLEFLVDPRREAINVHELKEVGTGRLLARQFLLPLLLGFKFNVISIIPIIFGIIALIAKKAIILSKIALVVSSAFALGTILFSSGQSYHSSQQYTTGQYGGHGHFGHRPHGAHGVHGGYHAYDRFPDENYADTFFRATNEANSDQLNVYPNIVRTEDDNTRVDNKKGRNFVWEDNDKPNTKPAR